MGRVFNKVFLNILMILLTCASVLALDAEYKNTLSDIELIKTGDGSYNINLYTQKKFQEPVKIIKKSDLNYYILLPETKNNISKNNAANSDIRSVSTKLYPYAGTSSANGYTKISIDTTKPVSFNVSVKSPQQRSAKNSATIASLPQQKPQAPVSKEEVQKKNSDFQKAKIIETPKVVEKPKQELPQKEVVAEKKPVVAKEKKEQAPAAIKKEVPKKAVETVVKKAPVKNEVKIEEVIRKEVEQAKKEAAAAPKVASIPEKTPEEIVASKADDDNLWVDEFQRDDEVVLDDNVAMAQKIDEKEIISETSLLGIIKNKISTKLTEYGLGISDIVLMFLAAAFSFSVMLVILTRKPAVQARIKSKNDLIDKLDKESMVSKKAVKQEPKPAMPNDGQYFVFENDISQTKLCDPVTNAIHRNYELSSYEPDLSEEAKRPEFEVYTKSASNAPKFENDHDIIQKILKEDTFVEIAPGEFEAVSKVHTEQVKKEAKEQYSNSPVTSPITKADNKAQKEEQKTDEPVVLSSVEIAPERGFMCVSYNDNINLMGYIFDDVFALHNFKASNLENYDIKFRLTEKDDKGANFIVKLPSTKMVVRVTKSSMHTEVVL